MSGLKKKPILKPRAVRITGYVDIVESDKDIWIRIKKGSVKKIPVDKVISFE